MSPQQMPNADDLMQRITIDPQICHGKPCIRGLRYPIEILLELLSAGMTVEEILADDERTGTGGYLRHPGFRYPPEPGKAYATAHSMKFLVYAHLPRRLAYQLRAFGHEAVHTLDLPDAPAPSTRSLGSCPVRDHAIVVTKDADFVNTFTIQRVPYKLLLVSTGNITNAALETLVTQHMA